MRLCVFTHLFYFGIAQTRRSGDGYVLAATRSFIQSGDFYDAVGINIKSNLNLRHTTVCWWDAIQDKFTQ